MKRLIVALALAGAAVGPSLAQPGGNKAITFVVPFAAGGPTDASARLVATALSRKINTPIVVENVVGAGSAIGTTRVANAQPDGRTLLWGSGSGLAVIPAFNTQLKYDPVKSFDPISLVVSAPFVLAVKPSLGVNSVEELVAKARANPGKLNFGSTGVGSSSHMIAEYFKSVAGVFALHIPYNGGSPMVMGLKQGDIDFLFDTPTTLAPLIKANQVIPLAVTSLSPWPDLPQVKTLDQLGYKKFEATTWFGLLAPKGTPADVLKFLNEKVNEVIREDGLNTALRNAGFFVNGTTPAGFLEKIRADRATWESVVKRANIQIQ